MPGFKADTLDFYSQCHALHVQFMRAIALGLQLKETFFDAFIDQQCHNLRLQMYPAMETRLLVDGEQARVHAHTGEQVVEPSHIFVLIELVIRLWQHHICLSRCSRRP